MRKSKSTRKSKIVEKRRINQTLNLRKFYSYFLAIKELKYYDGRLENGYWIVDGDLDFFYLRLYFLPAIRRIGGDFYCQGNDDLKDHMFDKIDVVGETYK